MESFDMSQIDDPLTRVKEVVASKFPQSILKEETETYLRYEFRSFLFRFVDDVEFLLTPERELEFRSASRVGRSDLGVNRRRMQQIVNRITAP